jgi:SanA protein
VYAQSRHYCFSEAKDVPASYTAIVLGAMVYQTGKPSFILQDRLDVAYELYRSGKIKRFLLTGDHGQKGYDEVNTMKKYLLEKGVDTRDIFLDHAGFDTYNSMVRAKEIFEVNDAVVVTQDFHLNRAVYLARANGLNACGIASDRREYRTINYLRFRELSARVKAFAEVIFGKDPVFLGTAIPITGDSKLSYD